MFSLEEFWQNWSACIYLIMAGVLLQQILQRIIFPWGRRQITEKISERYRGILVGIIEWPIHFTVLLTALYLGLRSSPFHGFSPSAFLHLYRSGLALAFFGMLYNLGDTSHGHLGRLLKRVGWSVDPILMNLLGSTIKVLTVILCFLTLAREWGYDISGFVAGLGLGGLALAMASKDSLANIFSGFVIITDKPFSIGDWIQTSGLEGTVEAVTFRSTRIKTFDQGIIHMPNTNLAAVPITNMSRMKKRRAKFTLGLSYSTTKEQLADCIEQINAFLAGVEEVSQQEGDSFVAFSGYGASSLEVLILYYTDVTDFASHTRVREKVNFAIMDIVEKVGTTIAFPSQSVYFETPLTLRGDFVENKTDSLTK